MARDDCNKESRAIQITLQRLAFQRGVNSYRSVSSGAGAIQYTQTVSSSTIAAMAATDAFTR